MGLQERITNRRHEEHVRERRAVEDCPLCPKDQRPAWRRGNLAKDLTTVAR